MSCLLKFADDGAQSVQRLARQRLDRAWSATHEGRHVIDREIGVVAENDRGALAFWQAPNCHPYSDDIGWIGIDVHPFDEPAESARRSAGMRRRHHEFARFTATLYAQARLAASFMGPSLAQLIHTRARVSCANSSATCESPRRSQTVPNRCGRTRLDRTRARLPSPQKRITRPRGLVQHSLLPQQNEVTLGTDLSRVAVRVMSFERLTSTTRLPLH